MSTWTLEGWTANLRAVPRTIQPLSLEAVEASGRDLAKTAQRIVPVKTGRLRASIGIGATNVAASRATADVEARTDYAAFVEYGTVNMAPRAYMRTSAAEITPRFRRHAEVVGVEALTRSLT